MLNSEGGAWTPWSPTARAVWQLFLFVKVTYMLIINCCIKKTGPKLSSWISQHSPGKQNQWDICIYKRDREIFFIGIGSHNNRGWEVPPSAICKLENQESWWYNSEGTESLRIRDVDGVSLSSQTWELGDPWCESWSVSEGPTARSTDVQGRRRWVSQLKQREKFAFPLPLHSIQALDGLNHAHLCWWRVIVLYLVFQFKCLSLLEMSSQTCEIAIMFYYLVNP